jgi:hypothetical protein
MYPRVRDGLLETADDCMPLDKHPQLYQGHIRRILCINLFIRDLRFIKQISGLTKSIFMNRESDIIP